MVGYFEWMPSTKAKTWRKEQSLKVKGSMGLKGDESSVVGKDLLTHKMQIS
jgi:hypothetical protein